MRAAEALALGRRVMACRGFRWIAGMLATGPGGPVRVEWIVDGSPDAECGMPSGGVPDLRDPATAGLLPALVREALKEPRLCAWTSDGAEWELVRWYIGDDGEYQPATATGRGPTEPEAWIAAWETA